MSSTSVRPAPSHHLVEAITEAVQRLKAENLVVIELQECAALASTMMICEGDNTTHTRAIAEAVIRHLRSMRIRPSLTEGLEEGRWILVDYFDVCLHVMVPQLREYYDLESLWTHTRKKRTEAARPL